MALAFDNLNNIIKERLYDVFWKWLKSNFGIQSKIHYCCTFYPIADLQVELSSSYSQAKSVNGLLDRISKLEKDNDEKEQTIKVKADYFNWIYPPF